MKPEKKLNKEERGGWKKIFRHIYREEKIENRNRKKGNEGKIRKKDLKNGRGGKIEKQNPKKNETICGKRNQVRQKVSMVG